MKTKRLTFVVYNFLQDRLILLFDLRRRRQRLLLGVGDEANRRCRRLVVGITIHHGGGVVVVVAFGSDSFTSFLKTASD